jgi:hypothetical protein
MTWIKRVIEWLLDLLFPRRLPQISRKMQRVMAELAGKYIKTRLEEESLWRKLLGIKPEHMN